MAKFLIDTGFEKIEAEAPSREVAASAYVSRYDGEFGAKSFRLVRVNADNSVFQSLDDAGNSFGYEFSVYDSREEA